MRNNCQTPTTPRSDSVTHQDSDDTQSRTLRQIVRETLRDPTQPDAAGTYQHTDNTIHSDEMNHNGESVEQGVEIISGESDYWSQFEEEVRLNSGRLDIHMSPLTNPGAINTQPPGELSRADENNSCDSLLGRQGAEYIEEETKDPTFNAHGIDSPLDLSTGLEAKHNDLSKPIHCPVGPDEQYVVSENYKKEVEKIKESVVRDLLVRTTDRKWMCKSCQITFISPTDVRRHIIAKHFSGPMCRCKHCGEYSKNEVALSKHVSRRHRAETEKELSQWQITKQALHDITGRSCTIPYRRTQILCLIWIY